MTMAITINANTNGNANAMPMETLMSMAMPMSMSASIYNGSGNFLLVDEQMLPSGSPIANEMQLRYYLQTCCVFLSFGFS